MIVFLHSLGLSFLVGMNTALALRLLGIAQGLPIRSFERLFPLMWTGFWINAASGFALTIADAATMLVNPIFYIKMTFVAAAVLNLALTRRHVFSGTRPDAPVTNQARFMAIAALILWTGAITAGRLTAYLGPAAALQGR
jgi:hypothetical protein